MKKIPTFGSWTDYYGVSQVKDIIIFHKFIETLRNHGYSQRTIDDYCESITHFEYFLNVLGYKIENVTEEIILEYRQVLKRHGLKKRNINIRTSKIIVYLACRGVEINRNKWKEVTKNEDVEL